MGLLDFIGNKEERGHKHISHCQFKVKQPCDGVYLKFATSNYAYYDSTKSSHLDKQSAVSALEEDF